MINVLLILLGLFLLVVGAETLVRGASNIAKKFHVPELLIGLTIVAIGTSLPELFVTVKSTLQGSDDLTVGNLIGSNLCNLLLILGIVAMIKPIDINSETKNFHIPVTFISTLIILGLTTGVISTESGTINFNDGIFLIILFIAYLVIPILKSKNQIVADYKAEKNGETQNEFKNKNIFIQIFLIIIGIVLLKIGGDLVVDYATIIAQNYGVSERIIGLTIVAIGTALPELVTSIIAVISNDEDLAIGNLIGSCALNLFFILGVGAIITPIAISNEFLLNLRLLIFSIALIWLFCYTTDKNKITRIEGFILFMLYVVYIVKLFV